jgi:hypothetical protein
LQTAAHTPARVPSASTKPLQPSSIDNAHEPHHYFSQNRPHCRGWYPNSKDVEIQGGDIYHSWYLEPEGGMCHVVMDEAGVGKDAAALRRSDETLMHRGHDLWLATLKWVAEAK